MVDRIAHYEIELPAILCMRMKLVYDHKVTISLTNQSSHHGRTVNMDRYGPSSMVMDGCNGDDAWRSLKLVNQLHLLHTRRDAQGITTKTNDPI